MSVNCIFVYVCNLNDNEIAQKNDKKLEKSAQKVKKVTKCFDKKNKMSKKCQKQR